MCSTEKRSWTPCAVVTASCHHGAGPVFGLSASLHRPDSGPSPALWPSMGVHDVRGLAG